MAARWRFHHKADARPGKPRRYGVRTDPEPPPRPAEPARASALADLRNMVEGKTDEVRR